MESPTRRASGKTARNTLREAWVYRVLDRPSVYRLAQRVLSPGAEKHFHRKLLEVWRDLPPVSRVLDVACGPSSRLWSIGMRPIGLDLSYGYAAAFHRAGGTCVTGSAVQLPFADGSMDGVWSQGLLHHLPDAVARQAVREMCRVTAPGGCIVIWDSVLPDPAWRRPIAYAIRKLDRGRFVRHEEQLLSLLPSRLSWRIERFTYSYIGLEGLGLYLLKA